MNGSAQMQRRSLIYRRPISSNSLTNEINHESIACAVVDATQNIPPLYHNTPHGRGVLLHLVVLILTRATFSTLHGFTLQLSETSKEVTFAQAFFGGRFRKESYTSSLTNRGQGVFKSADFGRQLSISAVKYSSFEPASRPHQGMVMFEHLDKKKYILE